MEDLDQNLLYIETELAALREKMESLFGWAIGAMITLWVAMMLPILFKG